jgi:hypothetical protein
MSPAEEPLTSFERNARAVLAESVARIDARTRSRLNQARHAALAESVRPRRSFLRSFTMMPAAGAAAAAVLVAVTLWQHQPKVDMTTGAEGQRLAVEDIDLLADSEALDLVEQGDGSFYEWAAAQTDSNGQSDG